MLELAVGRILEGFMEVVLCIELGIQDGISESQKVIMKSERATNHIQLPHKTFHKSQSRSIRHVRC